jgi:hypothetical protein
VADAIVRYACLARVGAAGIFAAISAQFSPHDVSLLNIGSSFA